MNRTLHRLIPLALAAALAPQCALGDALVPPVESAAPDADSASVAAPAPGYVFPTARSQFKAWAINAVGPPAIAGNLAGASWRQWVTDEPAEWDRDGACFAKRFGTGSLTTAIGETSLSLASALMRQDPGYYRSPRSGFGPRVRHALAMTFMARDRRGEAVFSPAKSLSTFVGPVVTTTTLYPERYTYADGLLSGAYGLLINAGWNLAREFVVAAPPWREVP